MWGRKVWAFWEMRLIQIKNQEVVYVEVRVCSLATGCQGSNTDYDTF